MRSTVRERTRVTEGRNRWMKTRPSLPARCRQSLLRLIRIASDANLNESRHYTCYDLHVPGTVDGEDVKLQRPTPLSILDITFLTLLLLRTTKLPFFLSAKSGLSIMLLPGGPAYPFHPHHQI
ncbi:hypothetical protein AAC387_Pa05g3070 [Persea americana]